MSYRMVVNYSTIDHTSLSMSLFQVVRSYSILKEEVPFSIKLLLMLQSFYCFISKLELFFCVYVLLFLILLHISKRIYEFHYDGDLFSMTYYLPTYKIIFICDEVVLTSVHCEIMCGVKSINQKIVSLSVTTEDRVVPMQYDRRSSPALELSNNPSPQNHP